MQRTWHQGQRTAGRTIAIILGVVLTMAACANGKTAPDPVCGNGILEAGEQCDEGAQNSDLQPDHCRRRCTAAACGDGVIDSAEECDDGNTADNDGCGSTCLREPRCGDGFLDLDEACDDGNDVNGDGCSFICQFEFVCGDGTCETDRSETCLLCPADCCPCGDGTCDDALGESCALCQADCCPDCGDGVLGASEQCDDGNLNDGDGCSAACVDEDGQADCGNGLWEAGEACDDGNITDGDGCDASCQWEFICGDGTCASANGETCQVCPADCCPSCGDGVIDAGEECDSAQLGGETCADLCYTGGTLSCTAWCSLNTSGCTGAGPACGDGLAECGEQCDGSDFLGQACGDFGYGTGALACTAGCTIDTSGCGPSLFYWQEDFDGGCPAGWTLGGDWQCGTPTSGPGAAHSGASCLGTVIAGNYTSGQSYTGCTADSPTISLPAGAEPYLSFQMWLQTESGYDGMNVKISTDGGSNFTQLTNVDPPYVGTLSGEPAWYGDQSAQGWQQVVANLSAYAGQSVVLRFAFRSDSSVTYPGPYLDDMAIVHALTIPLQITTTSPLPDANVGGLYSQTLSRAGGSPAAQWSIVGGTNHAWLSVDPATGVLSGTPGPTDAGAVSVTVRVEEPSLPSNFDEATFVFTVYEEIYAEGFDGGCPAGWTLGGDWQCGPPSSGPGAAFAGAGCIATNLTGDYGNNQTWSGCVADSPAIDLTGTTAPLLRFRLWLSTEGSTFDGVNVKVSTDCASYATLTTDKAYNATVNGEAAWNGDESGSGWQLVTADLSAYVGQTICLRFAFRSDGSVTYPGPYVDAVQIVD